MVNCEKHVLNIFFFRKIPYPVHFKILICKKMENWTLNQEREVLFVQIL